MSIWGIPRTHIWLQPAEDRGYWTNLNLHITELGEILSRNTLFLSSNSKYTLSPSSSTCSLYLKFALVSIISQPPYNSYPFAHSTYPLSYNSYPITTLPTMTYPWRLVHPTQRNHTSIMQVAPKSRSWSRFRANEISSSSTSLKTLFLHHPIFIQRDLETGIPGLCRSSQVFRKV